LASFAENRLELVARDKPLFEPAKERPEFLVCIGRGLGKAFPGQPEFSCCQSRIHITLVAIGERIHHLDTVELQCRFEPGTSHRGGKAFAVFVDKPVHDLGRGIKPFDRVPHFLGEHPIAQNRRAHLVLGFAHALVVAADAGDAVGDREILARLVEDDGRRALVKRLALRIV
jgi:hypothetical protein